MGQDFKNESEQITKVQDCSGLDRNESKLLGGGGGAWGIPIFIKIAVSIYAFSALRNESSYVKARLLNTKINKKDERTKNNNCCSIT